ncbi:MAG: glutaconyl-CoA/methylmalonyl-CoA decarboxylase subunit gamma [Thermoplasmata archaeon]|jgi:biotin carboxyl carrier protein|nr:glutaconyl-CoA/methylmalonyl-CoA decarboxylase subunit gamma [Thermoplasmata archaeon]
MRVLIEIEGEEYECVLQREGEVVKVDVGGTPFEVKLGEGGQVTLGGKRHVVELREKDARIDGQDVRFRIADLRAGGAGEKGGARGARIRPPMPGKIVNVAVQEGQEVAAGHVLLILEAMKMQNEIVAPSAGTIKKIHVKPGQNVEGKDVLLEIE